MKLVDREHVSKTTVQGLGLDSDNFDITSNEAIANLIRRIASFDAPCTRLHIIQKATQCVENISPEPTNDLKERIIDTLEDLVSYGTFIELDNTKYEKEGFSKGDLFLSQPSFIERASGQIFLIGVIPENILFLPSEIQCRIQYLKHTKKINPAPEEDLKQMFIDFDFIEIDSKKWLNHPKPQSAKTLLLSIRNLLSQQGTRGEIEGLEILDWETPSNYYKKRWKPVQRQTGDYVARRPKLYGAAIWCIVRLHKGSIVNLLDLPFSGSQFRGCDEAWHIQCAIDSEAGNPQRFRVRSPQIGCGKIIDVFSPLPMWAKKRWDLFGMPANDRKGLFSYLFEESEVQQEVSFLKDFLWLKETA